MVRVLATSSIYTTVWKGLNMKEKTMTYWQTYWQAETERRGEVDADFPHRATREEAIADAQAALSTLSDRERAATTARVCEMTIDAAGFISNTGRGGEVDAWGSSGPAATLCPHCGQANSVAGDDGAVCGPREYHAECWTAALATMTDEDIADAWDASALPE